MLKEPLWNFLTSPLFILPNIRRLREYLVQQGLTKGQMTEIKGDPAQSKEGSDLAPFFAKTRYAVTLALIAANVIVFVAMCISSQGTSFWAPSSTLLLQWGAFTGPYTFDGQYWRLFTCLFVHIGIQHLVYNMVSLLSFGITTESLFGSRKFLLLYFIAGLGGSIFSALFNAGSVCCGASGAVLGLYGGLFGFVLVRRKLISSATFRSFLRSIFVIAIWYVLYEILSRVGKTIGGVGHAAHIGGFVFGLICAWFYDPSKCQKLAFHPIAGTVALLALQAAIFGTALTVPFDAVNFKSQNAYLRLSNNVQARKWNEVIADSNQLIAAQSYRSTGFRFLSKASIELNQPQSALKFADEGLTSNPDDFGLWEAHDAALIALGQQAKCLRDLENALAESPDNRMLLNRQGLVKLRLGDFAGGAKDFHKLISTASWWESELGMYQAILAIVSYRLSGDESAAKKISTEALKMADQDLWQYHLLEYLNGTLTADELLAKASDNDKMTEANAYIGLTFVTYKTAQEQAVEHLQWVVDHGNAKFTEYDLAKAQLARMRSTD